MNDKLLSVPIGVWIAFFATALLFVALPGIDLAVSNLFYTPGLGFRFKDTLFEQFLYHSVEWATLVGSLALIGAWFYGRVNRHTPWPLGGRKLGLVLLALALGPGLVVNALLKEHWGRARPVQIDLFGGERAFTPAFVPSSQGGGSFSSGHAAAAFHWLTLARLAKRHRRLWLTAALAYGSLIGLARIAAGAHYLSDVITSFFIVWIIALILHRHIVSAPLMLPRALLSPSRWPSPSPALAHADSAYRRGIRSLTVLWRAGRLGVSQWPRWLLRSSNQARITPRSYLPEDNTGS